MSNCAQLDTLIVSECQLNFLSAGKWPFTFHPFEPTINQEDFNFYDLLLNSGPILLNRPILATEVRLNEIPKKTRLFNITIEDFNEGAINFDQEVEESKLG